MTCRIFVLLLAATFSRGADWPQFRGPNGQGITDTSVPTEWSAEKNLAWKAELPGEGSSCPIVWGDAVFVTAWSGEGAGVLRHLLRLDLATGKVVWEKTIPVDYPEDPASGYLTEHGYASNTPVTDGEGVYCYFGKAGTRAYDFDGNELWSARTGNLTSPKAWGSASSPILHGDLVIVPAGEELNAVVALKKSDGSEAWRAEGDALVQTYGTPILVPVDESRTDLVFAAAAEWWGINPDTGKLRWFAEYNLPGNMSNTTHLSADGKTLTISGGFPRTARVALSAGGTGDLSSEILYDTQKPATYMTAPVEHEGVLYWISDGGIAFAAEPGKAEELWEERIPGLDGAGGRGKPFYASPILAGGKIYAVSRANGTFVIEPSRDGLKIIAQNRIDGDDTLFNATPAAVDGRLLLRSQRAIYCIAAD